MQLFASQTGDSNKTFIHFCVNHCPIYFVPFSSFVKVFVLLCRRSIGLQAWSLDSCTKKKRPENLKKKKKKKKKPSTNKTMPHRLNRS